MSAARVNSSFGVTVRDLGLRVMEVRDRKGCEGRVAVARVKSPQRFTLAVSEGEARLSVRYTI